MTLSNGHDSSLKRKRDKKDLLEDCKIGSSPGDSVAPVSTDKKAAIPEARHLKFEDMEDMVPTKRLKVSCEAVK